MNKYPIKKLSELLKIQNGYAFDSKKFTIEKGTPLIRIRDLKKGLLTEANFDGDYPKEYLVCSGDFLIGMDGEFRCYEWKGTPALLNQRVCRLKNFSENLNSRYLFYLINKHLKDIEDVTGFTTVKHISSKQIGDIQIPLPPLSTQLDIVARLDSAMLEIDALRTETESALASTRELWESTLESVFASGGKDWVGKRLNELLKIKHGFAFKSEYFSFEGDYILLTPGNFYEEGGYRERGEKQKYYIGEIPCDYILNKGDLLVAMTEQAPGLLGSPILIPQSDKFLHNQRLGLIEFTGEKKLQNEFLFHFFNTKAVRKEIHDSASGTKVRHTSPEKIGKVRISFPPLTEQSHIVAHLDAVRAETVKLEKLYSEKLASLDELRKSILAEAFS